MARKLSPVLVEIMTAIAGVERATRGKSYRSFSRNWLLNHGVQRGIEIISEACRHIPAKAKAEHPAIPWRQVEDIGNVLRHEYYRIANEVIWAVVRQELPPLKTAIAALQKKYAGR